MFGPPATIEIFSILAVGLGIAVAFWLEARLFLRPKFRLTVLPAQDGGYKLLHRLFPAGEFIGRLLLALLFIIEGAAKLFDYEGAAKYMGVHGVPAQFLVLAIAVELGSGLLIVLGWQTRIAAALLAGFCVTAAVLFHGNFSDRNQLIHFEKDLALAGALLILWARGAGPVSLDARASPDRQSGRPPW